MNKKLQIALVMQGGEYWLGGTEYIKNIVLALASLPVELRSTFEVSLISPKEFNHSLYNGIDFHLAQINYLEPRTLPKRIYWKAKKVFLRQDDPQLEAFLKQKAFDFVYPCLTHCCPSAAWIYDFQHKYLPQFFTQREIKQRDRAFARIARQASSVVLSSKTAAVDFQQFFPAFAYKSTVLSFKTCPPASWYEAEPKEVQQQYSLLDRFFIVSNQFWKHKNHLVLFEALKLLREQAIYPIVVCTGRIENNHQPEFVKTIMQAIETAGITQQVHLLGMIPRLDQIQLMRRSLAVIQPSLFEGWSTVVEDARVLGKPTILSDISVHLEQNPPNSLFFKQHSPQHLAELLANWWTQLSPGPDVEQEAIARAKNIQEVQAFGQRFLDIAMQSSANQQHS
jgi:glycosyltransferase involved in cell wall biosynthesis